MKAWLSIEYREGNSRIEAWLSGPGVGPDFVGSTWKGWKTALPQGFGVGPQHTYRKQFDNLLEHLTDRCVNMAMSEFVATELSPSPASNKSPFILILAIFGCFNFLGGIVNLLSASSLIYKDSYLGIARPMFVNAIFDIFIGISIFASSRALAKGKTLAVWLFSSGILLDIVGKLITGEKLNYLFIVFGISVLWQISGQINQRTNPTLVSSE